MSFELPQFTKSLTKALSAGAALIFLLVCPSAAWAISPGCQALNLGTVVASFSPYQGSGFDAGDIITASITTGTANVKLIDATTGGTIFGLTNTFTYNVPPSVTGHTLSVQVGGFIGSDKATIACTPAPVTGAPTDSQNLRNLQIIGTQIIATQSGAAITGAVTGAIGDAFSPTGGAPITGGPNGFTANFAAEPRSETATRADDAFAALGYAKSPSYKPFPTKAPPISVQEWSAWLDVRGSGFDRGLNTNPTDIHAQQINVTGGVGRKITPDFLIGIFGGYENADVTMNTISEKMTGDGGTIGSYGAWRFAPNWRIDALGGWTGLNYSATAGTASGSFSGSRFIGAGGLTGAYEFGRFAVEPSSNVYMLTEREGAWTDSLGTLQTARTFTVGRVASGARLAAVPYSFMGDIVVSPYVGFYGDWRFSTDNALPVAVTLVGINNGWSGRTTGGFVFKAPGGASLALGGEYGGLGAPYKIWSGNVRGSVPF